MTTEVRRGQCSHCGADRRVRKNGTVVNHTTHRLDGALANCPGSWRAPVESVDWRARALTAEETLERVQEVPTHLVDERMVVLLADLNRALEAIDG